MGKGKQLLDSTPSHQWFITTGVDYLMAFRTRITGRGIIPEHPLKPGKKRSAISLIL
jgi:hypothetical protein